MKKVSPEPPCQKALFMRIFYYDITNKIHATSKYATIYLTAVGCGDIIRTAIETYINAKKEAQFSALSVLLFYFYNESFLKMGFININIDVGEDFLQKSSAQNN